MKYVGNRTDLGRKTLEKTPKKTERAHNLKEKQQETARLKRTRDSLSNIKRSITEFIKEISDDAIPLLIIEFNSEFKRK